MAVDPIVDPEQFKQDAYAQSPDDLAYAVIEFWPEDEWRNACGIARLESNFDAFALNDTVDARHHCGSPIGVRGGVRIFAERSVGYFQINACNFPGWEWQRFYNAWHNAGTAHMLWDQAGQSWRPWFFSATRLGLI